ncbi:MAG: acetate kinase, partial [Burkholderiales bacterium]|nr:acetate kinase [Burkholderiales bacterium]
MAHGPILVLNAGSSSLKFALYDCARGEPSLMLRGRVEGLHAKPAFRVYDGRGGLLDEHRWNEVQALDQRRALAHVLGWIGAHYGSLRIEAVSHRVVHGGTRYTEPVRVDEQVLADLEALVPLAPLHQPHNLAPMRLLREERPELPQIACFDTAFHITQPEVARRIPLPEEYVRAGVWRYGFHGLSYEYIVSVLPQLAPQAAQGRTVVMHLGSGASLCAMVGGRSVATTMGFTPLDGLVMATRCGSIDPGVLLYL